MKPFNLERALAGDPVVTRNGRVVCNLRENGKTNEYPLTGNMQRGIDSWTINGNFYSGAERIETDNDLFMAPTKKSGWMNIYSKMNCDVHLVARTGDIHESKERADRSGDSSRIACIYVEWEE